MAKGKQAAAAANRRLEAAQDHIDRLTDQLVEAKRRARDAERTAQQVEPLKRRIHQLENDTVSAELVAALNLFEDEYKKTTRKLRALQEVFIEQGQLLADQKGMTGTEYIELMWRRHPDMWTDSDPGIVRTGLPKSMIDRRSRLSDAAVVRLQKARGFRHSTDVVSLWEQLLDAEEAGFSRSEAIELLDDESKRTLRKTA